MIKKRFFALFLNVLVGIVISSAHIICQVFTNHHNKLEIVYETHVPNHLLSHEVFLSIIVFLDIYCLQVFNG